MLLIFLFIGFVFQGDWGPLRVVVSVLGFGACIMVVVGFKARWSAIFLVMLLSILNVRFLGRHRSPADRRQQLLDSPLETPVARLPSVCMRGTLRLTFSYDFFQTLSIVGGLILLVNMGPGA